ncbi:unnamed protein product [Paramecium octaurelia]|uniref:Uncharacterized protein n=1 Tax=Paramecium octaurelia TaxID=43137 RepID=A0A8S1UB06_PAROT|nr:unnamed protein product [Paramecium octaurelia]
MYLMQPKYFYMSVTSQNSLYSKWRIWRQPGENQIKTQFSNFILRRQQISYLYIPIQINKKFFNDIKQILSVLEEQQFQKPAIQDHSYKKKILIQETQINSLINLQNQTTSMQNYNIPSQPMFCYYQMQIYNPYFFYPQQIVVQNQTQANEYEPSNFNCFNIIKKQNLEETKPPEPQDSENIDFDVEDQDDKDEDYKVMCSKENSERNNIVNQLNGSTNLQKNYARAVILYVKQQNSSIVKELGQKRATHFFRFVTKIKNKIRNLSHINNYTRDEEFIRLFRILCNKFLRKDWVSYIYNSKIKQKTSHLKGKHGIYKNLFKI